MEHFLRRYGKELGKPDPKINPLTLEYLMQYNWPGNVRELENVIQRAKLLAAGGLIHPEHLPKEIVEDKSTFPRAQSLPELEKEARDTAARLAIYHALEKTEWNVRESARLLGIPEKTLYDKCARLGIKIKQRSL